MDAVGFKPEEEPPEVPEMPDFQLEKMKDKPKEEQKSG